MSARRARTTGRKALQGAHGARPGQRAAGGGLMAPRQLESGGRWDRVGVCRGCAWPFAPGPAAAGFLWSRGPWSGRPGPRRPGLPERGLRALSLESALGSTRAHGRRTLAPSPPHQPSAGGTERFIFGNLPVFSSLLSTPCPLLGGTARPPHYGRGREKFQQHPLWHGKASGRRGGLTREELGAARR